MRSIHSFGSLLVLTAIMIVFACKKTANNESGEPENPNPIEYVTANISGQVLDENGKPVYGAFIKAGIASTTSDTSGNFSINNVNLDKNAGFIQIEKEGFFKGSRTILVHEGVINYVSVQLIKKTVSGTVSGSTGGNITVRGGGSIVFTDSSFVTTAGNSAYTGTVSVSAYFINPIASNFTEIMPGALRGINAKNEETGLESFGMMAVDLTGASGEKLQLAPGKTATLTFPVPSALESQAQFNIPLWSFNDSTGLWKEEGVARRQGNNYVGTVSHFSFWNCDFPYSLVDFKAVFQDQNGNALYPARVVLRNAHDTLSTLGYGYTDNTGRVSGKIPWERTLFLQVYNKCKVLVYAKKIGPFSTTADLDTIKAVIPSDLITITGTAIDCNALPVKNGFVDISIDSVHNRAAITNGSFSLTVARCGTFPFTAVVSAYDLANDQKGVSTNLAVTSSNVNTGQLGACGSSLGNYLKYTINGVTTSFVSPADSLTSWSSPNSYTIWATRKMPGGGTSPDQSVFLQFWATSTGTVPAIEVYMLAGQNYYFNKPQFPVNMNITEFNPSVALFGGNFTGEIKDSLANAFVNTNLIFRVKK
jgi:hypothetical protein